MIKKQAFKVFVLIVILGSFVSFLSVKPFIKGDAPYDKQAIQNKVEEILRTWVIGEESQYYKNVDVKLVPTSININGDTVEAVFSAEISQMLKARTPQELPAIKGMMKFVSLNSKRLSQNKVVAVNKEINNWIEEVKGYIGKTETITADFKVVANISGNGDVSKDTVKFFVATSQGDFYEVDKLVESASEMEEGWFNHAKEVADKAGDITINGSYQDIYQRTTAASYADKYALNHNSAYYTCLNDCANFVSQALYAGGIPMDSYHDVSHWWCEPPKPPKDYSPWCYVGADIKNNYTGLRRYMINRRYFYTSDYYWANAGSVIVWKDDSHVAMVVQNDTITRALSQHDPDKRHYYYSGIDNNGNKWLNTYYVNNCDFYIVHCYVPIP